MTKPRHVAFASYAGGDARLVRRFLAQAVPRFHSLRHMEIDVWSDERVLAGEMWTTQLAAAIGNADIALLCVTPRFLASRFIAEVEIPALAARNVALVPVGLEEVDLHCCDLTGLRQHQIFRHRPEGAVRHRWFADCTTSRDQGRFCNQLARELAERLT